MDANILLKIDWSTWKEFLVKATKGSFHFGNCKEIVIKESELTSGIVSIFN